MTIKRLEDFESETGLPAKASREQLEEIGGRYMSSEQFVDPKDEQRKILEYIFLQYKRYQLVWKRLTPTKSTPLDIFTIHAAYDQLARFESVSYTDTAKNQSANQVSATA